MRFYLISDNIDTQMGMRLSGIEGVVVHTAEEVTAALDKAMDMPDVGVVLMTELAVKQCREKVYEYKLSRKRRLSLRYPTGTQHRRSLTPFHNILHRRWA